MNKTDKSIKILAIVVLCVVALALGLVIFSFLPSYFANPNSSDHTTKEGEAAIQIQRILWDNGNDKIYAYVKNIGEPDVTLSSVYVNGTLDGSAIIIQRYLPNGHTSEIAISETYTSPPSQVTIRIVTEDATWTESTETFDAQGDSGFQTSRVGAAIQIQSVARDADGRIKVYVQNVGDSSLTLSKIYVDGVLDINAIPTGILLSIGETATVDLTNPYLNGQITIKAVTEDGAFSEFTKSFR